MPAFGVDNLVKGADPARKIDIAMYVWLVRGGGRNILVDSGFYRPEFLKNWNVRDFIRPDEAVARAGVKADDVTDVVVTHMHWDHAGSVDLFKRAQVWIQSDEFAYYKGAAWQPGGNHGGVNLTDLTTMLRVNTEGRLHLVDGDREILSGVRVVTGGKHTWASQFVVVRAAPGTTTAGGDDGYRLHGGPDTGA